MRVLLLNDARIRHHAGEIVEVSPAEAAFLVSVKSARPVATTRVETTGEKSAEAKPKKGTRKK